MNRTLEIERVLPTEDSTKCVVSYCWREEPTAQDMLDDLEVIELMDIEPSEIIE